MSSGTDRAREVLERQDYDKDEGCRRRTAKARRELQTKSKALLSLAIKQHESLRREHMEAMAAFWGGFSAHHGAIEARLYKGMSLTCPECLVLLQWEQMWEEKDRCRTLTT